MTSIFAGGQFSAATPYRPVRLDTGTLSVGATLPKGSKPGAPEDPEKVPSKVPSPTSNGAAIGLAAGAAGSASANNSGTVGAAGTKQAQINASRAKQLALDHAVDQFGAIPTPGGVSDPITPNTSGADAGIPAPEWGITQKPDFIHVNPNAPRTPAPASPAPAPAQPKRGGFWGSLENWGSSVTNQVDHAMYSPNSGQKPVDAYEQQKYNAYWHGSNKSQAPYLNTGSTSAGAAAGGVQGLSSGTSINKTTDPGVTEPTNVWNPSGNGSGLFTKPGSSSLPSSGVPYSLQFQKAQAALPASSPAQEQQDFSSWEKEMQDYGKANSLATQQEIEAEIESEEEAMAG